MVESEHGAHNVRVHSRQLDVPSYRFSPQLREEIAVAEKDPETLVNMIVTARASTAQDPEFARMISDLRDIAEAHSIVYKK